MTHNTTLKQKIILLAFGFILSLIIIEIGLRLAGFVYISLQENRNKKSLAKTDSYRIMCLGESTTAEGGCYSYPVQLEQVLNEKAMGIQFSVINKGLPGTDTSTIISQLKRNLDVYKPNMLIVMMGINDATSCWPYKNVFDWFKEFIKDLRVYKLAKLLLQRGVGANALAQACVKTALEYKDRHDYPKTEELLKIAMRLSPKDDMAFFQLGYCYMEQGKFDKALEMFKKTLEISPKSHAAFIELGHYYQQKKDYLKAQDMFKRAIEAVPEVDTAYVAAGLCYTEEGKLDKAGEMLKKAVEVNPKSDRALMELGRYYQGRREYLAAEDMFKKAIEITPAVEVESHYVELGHCYDAQGKQAEAEEMFKKAMGIIPADEIVYSGLVQHYKNHNMNAQADALIREYSSVLTRTDHYPKKTVANYEKLKSIVLSRGIKLVCVQYAMRRVEPLKKIVGMGDCIVFVDNESVFKQALKNGKDEDYFVDRFGGDFGHCTAKGNRLLANNIAEAILKAYFNNKQ